MASGSRKIAVERALSRLQVLEELMQGVQAQLPRTWEQRHDQALVVETLLRLTVEAVMEVLPAEVQQRVGRVHAGYEVVRWRKPSFEHEGEKP